MVKRPVVLEVPLVWDYLISFLQFLLPFSRKRLLLRWVVDIVKEIRSSLEELCESRCYFSVYGYFNSQKQKNSNGFHLKVNTYYTVPGGASSEAWIRVYMIAPVKKFGRARLSTDFLINKHGGDFM